MGSNVCWGDYVPGSKKIPLLLLFIGVKNINSSLLELKKNILLTELYKKEACFTFTFCLAPSKKALLRIKKFWKLLTEQDLIYIF